MGDHEQTKQTRARLMGFAAGWLAEWAEQEPGSLPGWLDPGAGAALEPYRRLLRGDHTPTPPGSPLLSIFSRVQREASVSPPQRYWSVDALSLEPVTPVEEAQARQADRGKLWEGFRQELEQLFARISDEHLRFQAFTHLLHKWAWAVPCSYGEPGVSLYDEFRALSALAYASACADSPADEYLLVGGDVPGIQRTIYTITSRGAAKGLRGRSFFVQLLCDAVVRSLLDSLGLPETNVIYAAGGNFMLLAPKGKEGQVGEVASRVNEALLQAFEGDLALCVAYEPLPAADVGRGAFSQDVSRRLQGKLGRQKQRRFVQLAGRSAEGWAQVFDPHGRGGVRFCAVCQHERSPDEPGVDMEDGWKCERCAGFEELAQAIAEVGRNPGVGHNLPAGHRRREQPLMVVGRSKPPSGGERWQTLLWNLTGWWYSLTAKGQERQVDAVAYLINDLDLAVSQAHGFRFLANTTPRTPDGQVKTFEDLADAAQGLKRVGVLRMDVDDLGKVLTRWMPERTMAATSALSNALDRFVAGWLDAICREVTNQPGMKGVQGGRDNLLYVIYAGGDDLFVVGTWDLIPLLAERVQQRFWAYVGRNPALHISAGITIEDRRFPLYQAAERAGEALDDGAKECTRWVDGQEIRKNAISLLGQAVGWEEAYPFVKREAERLIELTKQHNVPRSLFSVVRAICAGFQRDIASARERGLKNDRIYYGPWLWHKVYQLSRMRQRYGEERVAQAIEALEEDVLTIEHMPYVGLAARWAEYLTRGGDGR